MEPWRKVEKKMGVYRASNVDVYDYIREPEGGKPGLLKRLIDHNFVEYNPLFFFSALCILVGVMLASGGLGEIGWKKGQLLLAVVVQAYEILLIAATALLFRAARQKRPAVILGLTAAVFLFDWTFRTESMGTIGNGGSMAAAVWAMMIPLKLFLLCWVFRLRIRVPLILIPSLAAVGIALAPHVLLAADEYRPLIHLGVTWLGTALAAAVSLLRPRLETDMVLSDWGRTVIRRAGKAIWGIWAGLYAVHLIAWAVQFGVTIGAAHAVPALLLVALLSRRKIEAWVWTCCAASVLISVSTPITVAPTALVAGVILALAARETGRRRLLVGSVLAIRLAVLTLGWQAGPLPESTAVGTAVIVAALIAMGVLLRLPSAYVAAGLLALPVVIHYTPRNSLEWGTSLLAIGFLSLIVGVAINWDRRRAHPGTVIE